jgi:protein-S-isoprenylcysteine O-methyltransferase Ste14
MNRFQIPAEERAISALFGAEFEQYCAQVRRWI